MTSLSFHSAKARTMIETATTVAVAARRAVPVIFRGIPWQNWNQANMDTPSIEAHRHGIALARPLLRALVLALAGAACFFAPWTAVWVLGAVLLAIAALIAVVGVARWDRTHLSVSGNTLVVEHGFLRRRSASVSLSGTVFEVERTLLGRILGYGTVIAGELEIDCVPRRLMRLLQQR
jgi:uncharacterized membrane protein YdbT with pleckstrin-like domain